jgi:hypothetical protein
MPIFSVSRSQNRFLKKGERYALSEKKIWKIEMAEASNRIPLAVIDANSKRFSRAETGCTMRWQSWHNVTRFWFGHRNLCDLRPRRMAR